MQYVRIDNDNWDDLGKVWAVHEYASRENSTAVTLILEDTETKEVHTRVVASHQIVWIED
jgi:hypothetical protein